MLNITRVLVLFCLSIFYVMGGVAVLSSDLWKMEAQEKVTLDTPVFTSAGSTQFKPCQIVLSRARPINGTTFTGEIRALFCEATGSPATFTGNPNTLTCLYNGTQAEDMMKVLNKANLSVTSLERRVMENCQKDGKLPPGTISGTPE